MSKRPSTARIMLAMVPACFFCACGRVRIQPTADVADVYQTSTNAAVSTSTIPVANVFVDPQTLSDTAKLKPWPYDGSPVAGVVNHHSLAADKIARFFKTLKGVRPRIRTFVVLSPDHFSRGQDISVSRLPYSTPMGVLDIDTQKMEKVAELGVYDGSLQRAFEREHGVGALAPFIKREFPNAKIVPIFLAHGAPHERLQGLGRDLTSAADDDTFIVVSSDMSHYLRHEDAAARDRETLGWFAHDDWPRLESATDKNTDSSAGLTVLHEYLERRSYPDKNSFRLLEHVDSFDYSHDASNVTSYILGFWE